MRERFYLPRALVADIEEHLTKAIDDTVAEFDSAWEDEDVVTGHLGGQMTTRQRHVRVTGDEVSGVWKWSLHYRKFRGRGRGAAEAVLGADGVFEFVLEGPTYSRIKSILFQSKMAGAGGHDLLEQCVRLSTWREAAFVILYDVDGFKAITLDAALQVRGSIERAKHETLAKFLVDDFIGCNVGDNDLRYVAATRELSWYSINNETVGIRFSIPNRFRLKVIPPRHGLTLPHVGRRIEPEQVHRHRMKATPDDVLKVQFEHGQQSPKQAVRQLARIYHTDFFADFSPQTRELLNARLQEFNEARTEVESRYQKQRRYRSSNPNHSDPAQPAKEDSSLRPGHLGSGES